MTELTALKRLVRTCLAATAAERAALRRQTILYKEETASYAEQILAIRQTYLHELSNSAEAQQARACFRNFSRRFKQFSKRYNVSSQELYELGIRVPSRQSRASPRRDSPFSLHL